MCPPQRQLEEGFPATVLAELVLEVLFRLDDPRLCFRIIFHTKHLFVLPLVLGFAPLFELLEIHGWVPDIHEDVEVQIQCDDFLDT